MTVESETKCWSVFYPLLFSCSLLRECSVISIILARKREQVNKPWLLLCMKHGAKCFTYIIVNTYKSPMKKIISISQIRTLKSQLVLQLQWGQHLTIWVTSYSPWATPLRAESSISTNLCVCAQETAPYPLPLRAEVGGCNNHIILALHQHRDLPAAWWLQQALQQLQGFLKGEMEQN